MNDLEKLTNAIPAFLKIVDTLGDSLPGMVILGMLALWFVKSLNPLPLLQFVGETSHARRKRLLAYLENAGTKDPMLVSVVNDWSDNEHFRMVTGISAERSRRHALINLHEQVQHRLSWSAIRRASEYFIFHADGRITIRRIHILDQFSYRFNQLIFGLACFGFVSAIVYAFYGETIEDRVAVVIVGIPVAVGIALFAFVQNLPLQLVKKIPAAIAEYAALQVQ